MHIKQFQAEGREVTLYAVCEKDKPLIVMNNFSGDGESVVQALKQTNCTEFNLMCVENLKWNHDMTPWYCPPVFASGESYTGGADEYLEILTSEMIPRANDMIMGRPPFIGIAGYSLAGLFALYAVYRCNVFSRVASMSGSLWFPDFREYCLHHEMKRKQEKVYLSLGNREARTRNRFLSTVQENTEAIAAYYKSNGLDVTFEMNPGNHFQDAAFRSAKGIKAIL